MAREEAAGLLHRFGVEFRAWPLAAAASRVELPSPGVLAGNTAQTGCWCSRVSPCQESQILNSGWIFFPALPTREAGTVNKLLITNLPLFWKPSLPLSLGRLSPPSSGCWPHGGCLTHLAHLGVSERDGIAGRDATSD